MYTYPLQKLSQKRRRCLSQMSRKNSNTSKHCVLTLFNNYYRKQSNNFWSKTHFCSTTRSVGSLTASVHFTALHEHDLRSWVYHNIGQRNWYSCSIEK